MTKKVTRREGDDRTTGWGTVKGHHADPDASVPEGGKAPGPTEGHGSSKGSASKAAAEGAGQGEDTSTATVGKRKRNKRRRRTPASRSRVTASAGAERRIHRAAPPWHQAAETRGAVRAMIARGNERGGTAVISRLWHGWTTPENADGYEALIRSTIFPAILGRGIAGLERIELHRRPFGAEVEFVTVMRFASWDAVKAFAGPDWEVSVVPPAARAVLARFDNTEQHYEVRVEGPPLPAPAA